MCSSDLLAVEAALPNAQRKDSQGICFLGQVPVQAFLERHIPDAPGPIVNAAGQVIGQHRGLHRYTIGQRKGIGLPSNTDHEFFVVVKKAFATNTLHVAFDHPEVADLYTRHATAAHFSWINRAPAGAGDFLARVRYRDPATPVRFQPRGDGSGQVGLDFPQTQRGLEIGRAHV